MTGSETTGSRNGPEADDADWRLFPPRTDTGHVGEPADPSQARTLAAALSGRPGAWVTFRDTEEVAAPVRYSNGFTPAAVYGLDASIVAAEAERFASARPARRTETYFHAVGYVRRPCAVVFETTGRTVSSERYEGIGEDWKRLAEHVRDRYPEALETVERWKPRRALDSWMAFRTALYMTEACADMIVGAEEFAGGPFRHHPRKPYVWSELLQAMGVDAVEDRNGFLTGDCGPQVAVLNTAAIKVLSAFANPAAAPAGACPQDDPSRRAFR